MVSYFKRKGEKKKKKKGDYYNIPSQNSIYLK